jgi:UDP-N-acetylglucosamine acyltransferase
VSRSTPGRSAKPKPKVRPSQHRLKPALAANGFHPTAIIYPGAEIGANCEIGPYCVVESNVVLGEGCKLHSHVVIGGHTRLGAGNEIFPFASIGLKTQDLKWNGGITRTVIGDRNTFREYVTINSATSDGEITTIGSNNHILAYSHIAHNVKLGSHVIMSNVATLAGHVEVEDHAVIGGLAAVHQFCRIGRMAIIGGCSKVVQDVPPFMLADGNPAATRTINKVGMERHGISETAQTALKKAFKILFRGGLTIPNALAIIEKEIPDVLEIAHLVRFVRQSQRGIGK